MSGLTAFHRRERSELLDTLEAVGPEAPSLCEGWSARHIAAHIVSSERMAGVPPAVALYPLEWVLPRRLAGPFRRPVQRLAHRELARADKRGWSWLLARLAAGPPATARLPWVQPLVLLDQWVHHEDIRRANGMDPRPAYTDGDDALWRAGVAVARFPYLRYGWGSLGFVGPGGRRIRLGDAEPRVWVSGAPGEVLLFMSGRTAVARVDVDGSEADLAALKPSLRV